MKPEEDFNQIKTDLVTEIKGMRTDFNRAMVMLDTHEKLLYGDKIREPGLAEEVRNLKGMSNHIKGVWVAVSGFFLEFMFRTFFHHPKG